MSSHSWFLGPTTTLWGRYRRLSDRQTPHDSALCLPPFSPVHTLPSPQQGEATMRVRAESNQSLVKGDNHNFTLSHFLVALGQALWNSSILIAHTLHPTAHPLHSLGPAAQLWALRPPASLGCIPPNRWVSLLLQKIKLETSHPNIYRDIGMDPLVDVLPTFPDPGQALTGDWTCIIIPEPLFQQDQQRQSYLPSSSLQDQACCMQLELHLCLGFSPSLFSSSTVVQVSPKGLSLINHSKLSPNNHL